MPMFELSLRERHAVKWHLNNMVFNKKTERDKCDRVWEALKLDGFNFPVDRDPETIDGVPVPGFELTVDQRAYLLEWFDTPMKGAMGRLIAGFEKRLVASRDEAL